MCLVVIYKIYTNWNIFSQLFLLKYQMLFFPKYLQVQYMRAYNLLLVFVNSVYSEFNSSVCKCNILFFSDVSLKWKHKCQRYLSKVLTFLRELLNAFCICKCSVLCFVLVSVSSAAPCARSVTTETQSLWLETSFLFSEFSAAEMTAVSRFI